MSITTITLNNPTNLSTAKTSDYNYDDLYRLKSATIINAANGQNYTENYSYDAIGNITNKSDVGDYVYAGMEFANPHAVTNTNGELFIYDNNGNILSKGNWKYVWDYANRMIQSANGVSTSTYQYDQNGQRVKKVTSANIAIYPSKYYEVENGISIVYAYAGDNLVAEITNGKIKYTHNDHLGSIAVMSDKDGYTIAVNDYYPYGKKRIAEGTEKTNKQFIGQYFDEENNLSYLNARYYDGERGQFTSQDPVFWEVGITKFGQAVQKNPQAMNSYVYANDNPIMYKDDNGKFAFLAIPIVAYAPIWVPAAITGVAAASAVITSTFVGESIYHLSQGNSSAALQSSQNAMMILGVADMAFGGIMGVDAVMSRMGSTMSKTKTISPTAKQIANGHAYNKHVINQGQFKGIVNNRGDFANHIDDVMNNSTAVRQLEKDRTAYYQQNTNTIVINDPSRRDAGTAFQPSTNVHGYKSNTDYFNKGLK